MMLNHHIAHSTGETNVITFMIVEGYENDAAEKRVAFLQHQESGGSLYTSKDDEDCEELFIVNCITHFSTWPDAATLNDSNRRNIVEGGIPAPVHHQILLRG